MQVSNETIYDYGLLSEASKVLTKRYKVLIGSSSAMFIFMVLYFGITRNPGDSYTLVAIPILGLGIILCIGAMKIKGYKETLLKRLEVVNHQDKVSCHYQIDDERITVKTADSTKVLNHKDITKISETQNQYVIIYTGGVFLLVAKAGFVENTEAEFRKIIKKYTTSNRMIKDL